MVYIVFRFIVKYRIYLVSHLHSKPRALATHGMSSHDTISRCGTGRRLLRLGVLALDLNDQIRSTLRTRWFFRYRGAIIIMSRRLRSTILMNSTWAFGHPY